MIIVIFSRPVFLFQSKLNNTDGVATIRKTPITIISIGKTIIKFIIKLFYQFLFLFDASGLEYFVNCRIGVSVRIHLFRVYNSQHESDIIRKLVGPINRGGGVREPKPPRKIIEISMTQISLKF